MPDLKIRITGDKELIKKLSFTYPNRIKAKIIEALTESSSQVISYATRRAPIKTGTLRRSGIFNIDPSTLKAVIRFGGPSVPYAVYQEYGTMDNRIDPDDIGRIRAAIRAGGRVKKAGRGIAPRLFLHGGAEEARPRIEEIFREKIRQALRA